MGETWILHIDMDAFFASVEQLDNPELRGKPVAVGGGGDRSVISAASYEIRKFGVHSAMPGFTARRLCPQGIFLPGRMHRYKEKSREVMAVLRDFSPVVEQASVDEAYIDGTGLDRLFGPVEELGWAIKARVKEVTGLTCSVGAAPVRFLAKIASDLDKPDGLSIIRPEDIHDFLRELPVQKIPGVGKQAMEVLKRLGVATCGDVLRYDRAFWKARFGKSGPQLYERCQGIDTAGVGGGGPAKSCSAENTFATNTLDRKELRRWLLRQADRVGADVRRHGLKGRTVTLKAKFANFKQVTRSRTLDRRTCETDVIFKTACTLLDELDPKLALRLIGLGLTNFDEKGRQLSLMQDDTEPPRSRGLDKAVDAVREKFGNTILTRADLMKTKKS